MNNKQNKIENKQQGFTLIELLVVISIIALLSSLGMVALNAARMKARDALRMGQMAQLRTAMSFYYDDHNAYPICGSGSFDVSDPNFGITPGDNIGEGCDCYNYMAEKLTEGSKPIMQDTPADPLNKPNKCDDSEFNFQYLSVIGNEYVLVYNLEDGGKKYIRGW